MKRFKDYGEGGPNEAPPPNRRPRFPLGSLVGFGYPFCAPSSSLAAVGEAFTLGVHMNRVELMTVEDCYGISDGVLLAPNFPVPQGNCPEKSDSDADTTAKAASSAAAGQRAWMKASAQMKHSFNRSRQPTPEERRLATCWASLARRDGAQPWNVLWAP